MSKWYVYICNRAGQLYTGITTDLEHRMNQHRATLLYRESFEDKPSAAKREREMTSGAISSLVLRGKRYFESVSLRL
jgi:predicted GIY-YIG superfamily endonuclease